MLVKLSPGWRNSSTGVRHPLLRQLKVFGEPPNHSPYTQTTVTHLFVERETSQNSIQIGRNEMQVVRVRSNNM